MLLGDRVYRLRLWLFDMLLFAASYVHPPELIPVLLLEDGLTCGDGAIWLVTAEELGRLHHSGPQSIKDKGERLFVI